jgi:hypothetical protein
MLDNDCNTPTDTDLARLWRVWAAACDANDHRAEVEARRALEVMTTAAPDSPLVQALRRWDRAVEVWDSLAVRSDAMALVEALVDGIAA